MSRVGARRRRLLWLIVLAVLAWSRLVLSEPRAAGHAIVVDGISAPPHADDLLGLTRLKFQGLIGSELSGAGYRVSVRDAAEPSSLVLVGLLKEEVCDGQPEVQCRIAIQWQLEDRRGVAVYRATTRAVDQASSFEALRRSLVLGALHSLLQRPRFGRKVAGDSLGQAPGAREPLGFRRCPRGDLELPEAARIVAAALVSVQAGSNLFAGTIVSPDGLILTTSRGIDDNVPLQVHFRGGQTWPASIVALERAADVALLHVAAHTDATCVPLGAEPLQKGSVVFGVGSEVAQDAAISLDSGLVEATSASDQGALLALSERVAKAPGGPLLDKQARLVGLVTVSQGDEPSHVGIDVSSALAALRARPAAATDPRLVPIASDGEALGYVKDVDDPPFVLSKRYTFGTSESAHTLRVTGAITLAVGATGVGGTWATFRVTSHPSPAAHQRLVIVNDISWVLVGLGAVGLGVSYALPEGHDQVAVRAETAAGREWFVRFGAGGLALGGRL
jgi:hypothetical protein